MAEDNPNARLIALTDGVLAIAMTLLVLDVRLPRPADGLDDGALWQALLDIRPQIFSYGLSFVVIALLWLTHVQKFRHIRRESGWLTWLHILFLLLVGFVPFTTSVLAENGNAVSTAVYAVVMATASLLLGLMSVHARLAGLNDEAGFGAHLHRVTFMQFGTAIIFYVSAALAFINAEWAKYFWILLVPLGLFRQRLERRGEAARRG